MLKWEQVGVNWIAQGRDGRSYRVRSLATHLRVSEHGPQGGLVHVESVAGRDVAAGKALAQGWEDLQ